MELFCLKKCVLNNILSGWTQPSPEILLSNYPAKKLLILNAKIARKTWAFSKVINLLGIVYSSGSDKSPAK